MQLAIETYVIYITEENFIFVFSRPWNALELKGNFHLILEQCSKYTSIMRKKRIDFMEY